MTLTEYEKRRLAEALQLLIRYGAQTLGALVNEDHGRIYSTLESVSVLVQNTRVNLEKVAEGKHAW